jgi:UPF0755 protein
VTGTGGPDRRGRHSSTGYGAAGAPHPDPYGVRAFEPREIDAFAPGHETPRYEPSRYEPSRFAPPAPRPATAAAARRVELPRHSLEAAERATTGIRRSGLIDRFPDETGPVAEPTWWGAGEFSAPPGRSLTARHSGDDRAHPAEPTPQHFSDTDHPSAPLPPRPAGVWDRLGPRSDGPTDDAETVASSRVPGSPGDHPADLEDATDAHDLGSYDPDQTGGLDVIGDHVEDVRRGRRGLFRRNRHRAVEHDEPFVAHADSVHEDSAHVDEHLADQYDDEHYDDHDEHDEFDHDGFDHDGADDDEIPIADYDPRGGRRRRRRRPVAVLFSLLVLGGLVVGIVLGGQKLLNLIDPSSQDFTGQGSGEVEIRVKDGDTLSDIARTLVDAGVIASIGPFIDAAEAHPDATGIQPGVYSVRQEMSGQAALDLMLDPVARLVSRVTVPEGLTANATLVRLSESTGIPVEEFEAAGADAAGLGLPAWTNGSLEGFLFPATYDFEPDTTATQMLQAMVARAQQAFTELQIPAERLQEVLTEASLVQAEAASAEDMAKVARVIENRIAIQMPLQFDTTVNYANGKSGITTTAEDRANPSPYNTYLHAGLPPGPINNPGEQALQAVLAPADGPWLFFVVVDPDTGETRFAATAEEHQQNVLLFQQWLRENPGG